jgi:hypothetical protein
MGAKEKEKLHVGKDKLLSVLYGFTIVYSTFKDSTGFLVVALND